MTAKKKQITPQFKFTPPVVDPEATRPDHWIRGVNLGGWLVLERYIVPYLFAVTDCHVEDGDLCWYPGQLSAPPSNDPDYALCDLYRCKPMLQVPITGGDPDYPLDEYTLAEAFLQGGASEDDNQYRNENGIVNAERWFNAHFDNFITEADVQTLAESGLTHIRVPLPHWILGDVSNDEPWIVGTRWEAFLRLCEWARKHRIQVWPDIHTAPGSQNGFDNSGHALAAVSCQGWSNDPSHVARSLRVIQDVTNGIVKAGYKDVVTGFGVLNEPFKDCNRVVYEHFLETAKNLVRSTLGESTAIYASDMFLAETFNNGHWWLDPKTHNNTYLDSHYYHVFAEEPRDLSPRQHIAYTCQKHWRDAVSCCYTDAVHPWYTLPWDRATNTRPSQGVKRLVGEWSAAYDTLPVTKLLQLMKGIAANGTVPDFDRKFTTPELHFLQQFVQAQMVAYESVDTGTSGGWFYWTAKMEGGAFAEWDYLRGVQEGWIPALAAVDQSSQEIYGTCYDIMMDTADVTETVIHTFPDPTTLPASNWQGVIIDDDVVFSHGESLILPDGMHYRQRYEPDHASMSSHWLVWIVIGSSVAVALFSLNKYIQRRRKQAQYQYLQPSSIEV